MMKTNATEGGATPFFTRTEFAQHGRVTLTLYLTYNFFLLVKYFTRFCCAQALLVTISLRFGNENRSRRLNTLTPQWNRGVHLRE